MLEEIRIRKEFLEKQEADEFIEFIDTFDSYKDDKGDQYWLSHLWLAVVFQSVSDFYGIATDGNKSLALKNKGIAQRYLFFEENGQLKDICELFDMDMSLLRNRITNSKTMKEFRCNFEAVSV